MYIDFEKKAIIVSRMDGEKIEFNGRVQFKSDSFEMSFSDEFDPDLFWSEYDRENNSDFSKQYEEILNFMRDLMAGKDLKKRSRELGILEGSMVSFVNGGEVRDKTLARLMSFYEYPVEVVSSIGFEMKGELSEVIDNLNDAVRDQEDRSAYAISKAIKVNYATVNSWVNGISNLSLVNLAKLVQISIKF